MKKKLKLPPGVRVVPSGQTKIAFSYIRFSSKKQEHGHSLVRQLKMTREYCKAVGLTLDESKSFRDLGVSAWKGKNMERGFGELIAACDSGLIPPGSALVVEALDRISRMRPRKVANLFSRLLDDYGLEVHLTGINKVVYPDSPTAADEAMDLLLIAMLASRASDEQETKSERLKAAFADKRERVARGEALMETNSNKMPWWVEVVGVGKGKKPRIVATPERAKIVQLIYKWTSEGMTAPVIARKLHEEGVPTWRPKTKHWTSERVRDLINTRAPEGFLEETPKTRETGLTFSIPNYYPKLVSESLAAKARLAMKANRRYGRGHEVKGKNERPINIMRGLIRYNGRWCRYSSHANGKDGDFNGYYSCYDELTSKNLVTISSMLFEPTLLAGLVELSPGDLAPEEKQADPATLALVRCKAQLADVEKKIRNLTDDWEAGLKSPSLAKRLQEREKEQADLNAKIADLNVRVQSVASASIGKTELKELKSLLEADLRDNVVRERFASVLKRLVLRVDFAFAFSDKLRSFLIKAALDGEGIRIPDPLTRSKRRKPMLIFVTFRRGGHRLILRMSNEALEKLNMADTLISFRVGPDALKNELL